MPTMTELTELFRDFTQAWMELGALVCVPNGEPHCEECPLKRYLQGIT